MDCHMCVSASQVHISTMHAQVMQNHGLINYFQDNVTIPLTIHNPNLHGEDSEEVQENPYCLDRDTRKPCLSGCRFQHTLPILLWQHLY